MNLVICTCMPYFEQSLVFTDGLRNISQNHGWDSSGCQLKPKMPSSNSIRSESYTELPFDTFTFWILICMSRVILYMYIAV